MYVFIVLFLLVAVVFANDAQIRRNTEKSLRRWAEAKGFRVLSIDVIKYPSTGRANPCDGLAKALLIPPGEETEVSRDMAWNIGFVGIVSIEFLPPTQVDPKALGVEADLDQGHLADLSSDGQSQPLADSAESEEAEVH